MYNFTKDPAWLHSAANSNGPVDYAERWVMMYVGIAEQHDFRLRM